MTNSVAVAQRSSVRLWWGVVVVSLETPKRIQRTSMSPELHDRAVGAERTCAGAEILDLIARVGERRIADFTAPEIFLTECAGGTTGQPYRQPCKCERG